ncbi:hypothetical protein EYF80_047388 [Liparis tanakae]|uniref:Uncharacterized protein n=1 Tax=Liparis tanakae TaxID=230148 RepID=A0A4Z2FNT8_9TELE|nr:hypothetical protein EYF80_047388 [Liparis tanakae]
MEAQRRGLVHRAPETEVWWSGGLEVCGGLVVWWSGGLLRPADRRSVTWCVSRSVEPRLSGRSEDTLSSAPAPSWPRPQPPPLYMYSLQQTHRVEDL